MSNLPDPFQTTSVPTAWESLHDTIYERSPELLNLLTKGASKAEQDTAEKKLGFAIPKSVRAYFYFLTPKNDDDWFYLFSSHPQMSTNVYAPLSLAEALIERDVMLDVRANLSIEERSILPADNAPFYGDWFHPSWLPIARSGGGDFLVVELDPPKGGRVGQIIETNHDENQFFLRASDISELLLDAEQDIINGKLDELLLDADEERFIDEPPAPFIAEEMYVQSLPEPPVVQVDNTPDGTEPLGGKQDDDLDAKELLITELNHRASLLLQTAETMPDMIHQDVFAGIGVRIIETPSARFVAFRASPSVQVNNWIVPMRDVFFPEVPLGKLVFVSSLDTHPLQLGELALSCRL